MKFDRILTLILSITIGSAFIIARLWMMVKGRKLGFQAYGTKGWKRVTEKIVESTIETSGDLSEIGLPFTMPVDTGTRSTEPSSEDDNGEST